MTRHSLKKNVLLATLLTVTLPGLAKTAAPEAAPGGAGDILNADSYWRWYTTLRRPTIPIDILKAAGLPADAPLPVKGASAYPPYNAIDQVDGPPPQGDWAKFEFDDDAWSRSRLTWFRSAAFGRYSTVAVCLRGRFEVTDLKAVGNLQLTLQYYGGVVVYLNGQEVARGDMPAGVLVPETLADPYPDDASVDAKGELLPAEKYWGRLAPDVRADVASRVAKRRRTLGPIQLPAGALRQGTNILAIDIRRAGYPAVARLWFKHASQSNTGNMPEWIPIALAQLSLQSTGSGVTPAAARPKEPQVWVQDRNDRICTQDYGEAAVKPVIKMVGARNGSFCGQLALGAMQPIRNFKVVADDLAATGGGKGLIAATNVAVMYGLLDGRATVPWFASLQAELPAEMPVDKKSGAAIQTAVLRVRIPKDAAPGDYNGHVSVSADGVTGVTVPVSVHVADWAIPDPRDYRTYVGLYQSPTSLAMQYKVKEWSEEHWKLMDRSFALLARAGNKMVNIPVVDQTQFGNDDGMVYWVKKAGGDYTYDLTVFDRFLDLAKKHFGTLDYVVLHVWHAGGWEARATDQHNTVTVINPDGTRQHMQVPKFGTDEAKRFWKPVLDVMKAHMAERGLEKALCIGILSDSTAPSEVFTMFDELLPPAAHWHRGCHSAPPRDVTTYRADRGGGVVVLHEHCYGRDLCDPDKPLPPFWKFRGRADTAYDRISSHEGAVGLTWYRDTATKSIMTGTQGIGRIGLDFWDVLAAKSEGSGGVGSEFTIYNRFPFSSCAQREPSLKKMTMPGPNGAATTVMYEAFCEGIQDCEALLYISDAVDNQAAKLGPELTAEGRQVMVDLVRYHASAGWGSFYDSANFNWQDLSRRLYECAARIGKKLVKT